MARLPRFESHRFVGLRDTMIVYDSDDPEQYELLAEQAAAVAGLNLLSTFAPDTEAEARNRGFRPVT